MLSKEEIETCKEEARNFIEFMETAGDNAGWIRGLMWYIDKLETKTKELSKGQQSLIKNRRKWKKRYYKMKNKNKDLQKSVEQIYDDYQDIGRIAFDYSDKIDQLESREQKLIEKLEEINTRNAELYNSPKQKELDFSEWNLAQELLEI